MSDRPALFLAGLLAACSSFPPPHFRADTRFDELELGELHEAAAAWNAITAPSSRIAFDGIDWYVAKANPPGGFNGITDVKTATISIAPVRPDGATVYVVALHEFGHALGLRHICTAADAKGPSASSRPCTGDLGVMDPHNVKRRAFSALDVEECKEADACPR